MIKTSIFYRPSLDNLKTTDGEEFSIRKYISRWRKLADRGRRAGPSDQAIIDYGAQLIADEPLYYVVAGTKKIWSDATYAVNERIKYEPGA